MVTLPVIAAAMIRLAFGGPEPVTPEARAAQEEVMRYRIRRLDVGDKNGWTFLTNAVAAQPKAAPAARDALNAALDGKPWNAADLKPLADQAPACRAIMREAMEKPYWQSPWDPAPESKEAAQASAALTAPVAATRAIAAFQLMELAGGRTETFLADLKLLLKLADTSMKCGISLEEWLAATVNHQNLNRLVVRRLAGNNLDPATLRELSACLENSPLSVAGVRESLRHSAAIDLAVMLRLGATVWSGQNSNNGKPDARPAAGIGSKLVFWLTFSPDETAAYHRRLAAEIIARCDEPCDAAGHRPPPALRLALPHLISGSPQPLPITHQTFPSPHNNSNGAFTGNGQPRSSPGL